MVTTTIEKKPRCQHHNFIKVKALYYLSKCEVLVTSADIAKAINANPDSLYVLLNRWAKWEYVRRYWGRDEEMSRYLYALAPKGRLYLKNLDRWYAYRDQAINEVDGRLRMKSWVIGYFPGLQGSKGKFHVIQYPYERFERDYFVVDDISGDGYYKQVTSITDYFQAAREYKRGALSEFFMNQVRNAMALAIKRTNAGYR